MTKETKEERAKLVAAPEHYTLLSMAKAQGVEPIKLAKYVLHISNASTALLELVTPARSFVYLTT